MEKINDGTNRYSKSHFGYNFLDWDFNMDLNITWIGIVRSLFEMILKKLGFFPRPIRKGSAVTE
ncbi:MAG: hypothetical protein ACFFAE_07980 [Candidatus Hodarchaeota archaeon]